MTPSRATFRRAMAWTTLLFSFEGRIDPRTYWRALGFLCLLLVAVYVLALVIAYVAAYYWLFTGAWVQHDFAGAIFTYIFLGGTLALTSFSLTAIGIKRLHDQDKGGLWITPYWAGPVALTGLQLIPSRFSLLTYPLSVGAALLTIGAVIALGCLDGTAGSNKYGPDPKSATLN
jgi:uncharacterized membrane protein YhaH (DUF805 family)